MSDLHHHRRCKRLGRLAWLGVLVIGVVLSVVSARAAGCVSAAQCTGAGGVLSLGATPFCDGGTYDGTPICPSGTNTNISRPKTLSLLTPRIFPTFGIDDTNDEPDPTDPFQNDRPDSGPPTPLKQYPKPQYVPPLFIPPPPQVASISPNFDGHAETTTRSNLGMYISPATISGFESNARYAVTRNSGYGVTDTAGLLKSPIGDQEIPRL
jgi:hypothetical protein